MTTTSSVPYTQIVIPAEFVSINDLEAQMIAARIDMDEAWKIQSVTTVDEGYTYAQANAAIEQAVEAQRVYFEARRRWNEALEKLAILQADFEIETVDGLVSL